MATAIGVSACVGCAAPSAPCAAAAPAAPAIVAIAPVEVAHGAETVPDAAPEVSRCYPDGRPTPRPPPTASTFCTSFDMHQVARVEARLRKEMVIDTKPSKLVIDFGCDVAYGATRELVLEQGSGHGGSLVLTRLQRGMDRWSVRRIASSHYSKKSLTVEVGDVPAIKLGELVAAARVAMLAKPHVIPLFDPALGHGSGSGSFSSRDFHLYLGIVDDAGRTTARGFTGYDTSSAQGDILPMRYATEPLAKLVDAATFTEVQADSDDRAFFTARLVATLEHDAGWWVRERYLENASKLATRDAVPALAARIVRRVADGKDGSDVRSRDKAIEALHVLTGWDPRIDTAGRARSIEATVAEVRRECLVE